jgi:hypothetical protein
MENKNCVARLSPFIKDTFKLVNKNYLRNAKYIDTHIINYRPIHEYRDYKNKPFYTLRMLPIFHANFFSLTYHVKFVLIECPESFQFYTDLEFAGNLLQHDKTMEELMDNYTDHSTDLNVSGFITTQAPPAGATVNQLIYYAELLSSGRVTEAIAEHLATLGGPFNAEDPFRFTHCYLLLWPQSQWSKVFTKNSLCLDAEILKTHWDTLDFDKTIHIEVFPATNDAHISLLRNTRNINSAVTTVRSFALKMAEIYKSRIMTATEVGMAKAGFEKPRLY